MASVIDVRYMLHMKASQQLKSRILRCLYATSATLGAFLAVAYPDTARAQSLERNVIVTVVDANNEPVRGLTTSDFEIFEEGAEREVLRVSPAGQGRQITILVDTSQSSARVAGEFRDALGVFFEAMHSDNRISLVSFGGQPRILVDSTTNLDRLNTGLGQIFGFPGTAAYLLDAMSQVAEGFLKRDIDRPVMLALATEGIDYSNRSARQVLNQLTESRAAFYALVIDERGNGSSDLNLSQAEIFRQELERNIILERGPRDSGGKRRQLLSSTALERAIEEIVIELKNQYLVTYARPNQLIPPEHFEVNVVKTGLTARGTFLRDK